MNKYTFKILPAIYSATQTSAYNEVEHKILNQNIEEIRILIEASDMKESFERAKNELSQIIAYNFGDIQNIDNYAFRLRIVEVQN
jgi:hypothetical protein